MYNLFKKLIGATFVALLLGENNINGLHGLIKVEGGRE